MKVLVAIENREDADVILESIRQKKWSDGTLFILLNVVHPGAPLWDQSILNTSEELRQSAHAAKLILFDVATQLRKLVPNATAEVYLCYGSPAQGICKEVKELHPDVLIIGSHCPKKLNSVLHPSVAEQVIERLPSAVSGVRYLQLVTIPRQAHAAN